MVRVVLLVVAVTAIGSIGSRSIALASERAPQTAPLMRGTLWWVVYEQYQGWTREDFGQAIEKQRAAGFDVLWIFNTPDLLRRAEAAETACASHDIMDMIHGIADEKGMHVIVDLPTAGWYKKTTAEAMPRDIGLHATRYHARYGHHDSFFGWYLNHEINPIIPGDTEETAFWRTVWRQVAEDCHGLDPESVVTISPFFLLDEARRRGFVYLSPSQYAAWWGKTMAETGIDILMLQDSGEHLGFFTLEQRRPFFEAVANACHAAGAQFWVNVETGEYDVSDWDDYIERSAKKEAKMRFTPIGWLKKKLDLAARYGDSIINWGYFPFMDPMPAPGQGQPGQLDAYNAYKAYYEEQRAKGAAPPPLQRRTPSKSEEAAP